MSEPCDAVLAGAGMRTALGMPGFTVDDETEVVLERFRPVADLRRSAD